MIEEIEKALGNHGVIAFPTETVMGLGVVFDDELAFEKLNKVKGRPENKPYTLMLNNKEDIEKYAYLDEISRKIINAFFPGPLTILLKIKPGLPYWIDFGSGKIGIRIPNHKVSLSVLKSCDKPLLVPSANKSGEKPAINSEEVKNIFNNELDYIVEGSADADKPSTIIDLTSDRFVIIRQGSITEEDILKVLEE